MTILRWIGGSLSRTAGTGLVFGTIMLVFGMTPGELVVLVAGAMPDWVFGGWFKLALVVLGLFIIWGSLRFNVWSQRQKAVNELAKRLSDAIRDLMNRQITNDVELGQFESDFGYWCDEIANRIEHYAAYFSEADKIHFDQIGQVPGNSWGHAYVSAQAGNRHNHLLNELNVKFERLRDIINWAQQRTR